MKVLLIDSCLIAGKCFEEGGEVTKKFRGKGGENRGHGVTATQARDHKNKKPPISGRLFEISGGEGGI